MKQKKETSREVKCVICGYAVRDQLVAHDAGFRKFGRKKAYICHDCQYRIARTVLDDACGITDFLLPDTLESGQKYDKWGNQVLSSGKRIKGRLFHDSSVQKVLSDVMHLFTNYVKYPRCYHLPWTECKTSDDKLLENTDIFTGKKIVVTEKMDGENTSMYCDHIPPRAIEGSHHPTQSWVKNFHSKIQNNIPEGWRVCGENLFAKHSIHYIGLPSYFLGFSIWDEANNCLSWEQTLHWFDLLHITPVPTLYTGEFDEELLKDIVKTLNRDNNKEGYVIRIADTFHFSGFKNSVAKYVKKDHITSDTHWRYKRIIKNSLDGEQILKDFAKVTPEDIETTIKKNEKDMNKRMDTAGRNKKKGLQNGQ